MRIPQPRDGWRVFAGEVGVIVLGVLIALGAQQAVEDWQTRQDVAAFRETIDQEIAFNLYVLDIREGQIDCDVRREAELRDWIMRSRAGGTLPNIHPIPPGLASPYVSAWTSRDAETFRQLPKDLRRRYAMLYDLFSQLFDNYQQEIEAWQRLQRFVEPGPVSLEERRDAMPDLAILKGLPRWDRLNAATARRLALEMGISAIRPQDIPADYKAQTKVCRALGDSPART